MGSIVEARIAGTSALTSPTTIRMPLHTPSSCSDSIMWMSADRLASSSNSDRNGCGLKSDTSSHEHAHASRAAGDRGYDALEQELQQDRAAPRAERLADADLPRPLGHRHEHDVHDADAADRQRQHADEAEHQLQPEDDAGRDLGGLRRAEHAQRPIVGRD